MILKKKVHAIPKTRVIPTVLIGCIGTNHSQANTLNPIIVVIADSRTA